MIVILLEINGNGETVTWDGDIDWAFGEVPELSENNGKDVIALISTDGTNWLGSLSMSDVR